MANDIEATLQRLREEFIAQLSARVDIIGDLIAKVALGDTGAAKMLHTSAHSLVGAAGVHRLMEISEAARNLEKLAAALESVDKPDQLRLFALQKAFSRLSAAAANPVHGYQPPPASRPSMRILIVDDDPEQSIWLRSVLEEAGYHVEVFNRLADCREACGKGTIPAAVIMDIIFPEGARAGLDFFAEMASTQLKDVPVIFLSVRQDIETKLAAHRAGATRYLTKPVNRDVLLRAISRSTTYLPERPYRILLVDDDREQLAAYTRILRQAGMDVHATAEPLEVPALLGTFPAEAIVLDMYMPECTGPELAALLRDDERHASIPIIYLSAEDDVDKQFIAMAQGGVYFLSKPVETRQLTSTVTLYAGRYRQSQEQIETLRATLYERERHQHALNAHAIVSISDAGGNILYINEKFCQSSGYSRGELVGQTHRLIKSGVHPPEFYAEMWRTISDGVIWHGEVCNRRKDGSLVWLETTIVPFLDTERKPYQYISIRTDITRVKEAEHRLALSQAYANIGTWDWNIETGELFWSERIGPLFGHPVGKLETTYENFLSAVHPDDRQSLIDAVNACVERGAEYNIEHRCVWPDGSVHWLLERGDVVRSQDSTPLHMLGVVQDITARKLAEIELAENRKRLEEAQHLAKLGYWSANLASGGLVWSKEVYVLFGRAPETYTPTLERYYDDIVHPDDVKIIHEAQRRAMETHAPQSVDHRIVLPDGSVRWIHLEGYAEFDQSGKAVSLAGTVQDITERKLTEKALEESRKRLEEAQSLAKLGYWTANKISGELQWSEEIYRIFGLDPAEFRPSVEAFKRAVHPEDLVLVEESERRAAVTGVHDVVHRIVRPNGEIRYVHELARAQTNEAGQVTHLAGTVQDVTELKQAEQAMQQAKEAAEAASRAKSEFLASMSHELRTPLNSILGFAQLFGMDPYLPEKNKEHAQEIERAGQHLLKLVNDLIDLARIEAGKMELAAAPVSIKAVVSDSLAMVAPIARERDIRLIDAGGDGRNAMIRADYTRLQQVLINLLANAIKYNHPQGTVHISCHSGRGLVRLSITDSGPGIPANKQSRMFNPFDRLGVERGQVEGSGIGLVITKRIVEAMGGTIGFESIVGQGSTFWVEFPVVADSQPQDSAAEKASIPGAPTPQAMHRHVLYIEDNPMNQRLMQQVFAARSNLELRVAHTAEIGIQLSRAEPPELILMDINLPGMSGYEALEALAKDPRTARIPIVAVSANAMKGDEERGLKAGFAAYLTKPIDIPTLFSVIGKLIPDTQRPDHM
ncbi:PAS domain-containing protein [Betaproteobacteria bacterium SCN2]|jgi:PAS domain S-box-containing protein|nr:PAS domain-containing protein [Betaproteobacteria bacterium SCN2]